jgi:CubicO group peptidase (beta-lactamase class C family)
MPYITQLIWQLVIIAWIVSWPAHGLARPLTLDAALGARIDAFVESERRASGIPGIALAIVHDGGPAHVRGFGQDGRGAAISGDTPFPIGSLTKSFTALLVRQFIEAGQLNADAPVQRYLPWFRVTDAQASARITLRHLLNQTSGFSRADGIAPLLQRRPASIDELAPGLAAVSLNRPVGERLEYSNLNFVLLGAVLQTVTGRTWQDLVRERVLEPLAMTHSHTDHHSARGAGMTALHRIWFGIPAPQDLRMPPGVAPTGGLIVSAGDMARYLAMLLAGGAAPSGQLISPPGVAALLAPASPPAHTSLLSADFDFRYGEGWFVGPFGVATDACWHLGSLTSFAAWMVLLPETKQAVVVLINANTELPINQVNAVMSRLPIGVVNLLRGQPPPQGPSLRNAYLPFNVVTALTVIVLAVLAWWAARSRLAVLMALAGVAIVIALYVMGLNVTLLATFAPDLGLVFVVVAILLYLPIALRAGQSTRRWFTRGSQP